jgi:hypothetical protein
MINLAASIGDVYVPADDVQLQDEQDRRCDRAAGTQRRMVMGANLIDTSGIIISGNKRRPRTRRGADQENTQVKKST